MEPFTVMIAKLLRRHPVSVPYVLLWFVVLLIVGLHPW